MIEKLAFEIIIVLGFKEMISDRKIIDIDIDVFTKKIMVTLVFELKDGSIYREKIWTK